LRIDRGQGDGAVGRLRLGARRILNGGANQDPNRLLPLDVARELEKEDLAGSLHGEYLVTTGTAPRCRMRAASALVGSGAATRGITTAILTAT
jgi:glycine reductase